jgi:hypothetical protein
MNRSGLRLGTAILLAGLFLFDAQIAFEQPFMKISGQIFDEGHGILFGASVDLFSVDQFRETKSGGDGRFELTGLSPGVYELQVKLLGFRTKTIGPIRLTDKDEGPISIVLDGLPTDICDEEPLPSYEAARPDNVSLVGSVRDYKGKAIASARVELSDSVHTKVITSNDRGEFRLVNVEPGKYVLSAKHPDYFQLSTLNL